MTSPLALRLDTAALPEPQPASRAAHATLTRLRMAMLGCRTAARLDLFEACTLLDSDGGEAAGAYAAALVRTLGQALGRAPRIHAPGSVEASFDEEWLVRLIERARAGDDASVAFLIGRRVPREKRRSVAFLISGLAARLDDL